jgi:peptide/nickel transport system permease protein
MKLVLLWSDMLIFLLVGGVLFFFLSLRHKPQTLTRWRKVFQRKVGASSFIVIMFYLLVALVDSVHFRDALPLVDGSDEVHYSNEVKSLLDVVLAEMREQTETTYSAPFAIHSFAMENTRDEQGRVYRHHPRLEYGGRHLAGIDERSADILSRSALALVYAVLVSIVVCSLLAVLIKQRFASAGLPVKTIYATICMLVMTVTWLLELGSVYHVFGTDKVGTDVLYQSFKAIRTGVLIGTLATILTLPLAILLGISAGYFKGWVDDVVQYIYTTLNSIPGILLIAASILLIDVYINTRQDVFELTIQRADFKFLALCLILGLTSWTGLCRLLRAETLKVSQLEYVSAARAFGVSPFRIIGRHILPNLMHIVLITLVLDFSGFVLAESVLSYIGVGVDASMMSWGNMINAARSELSREPVVWWSVSAAFVFMFVLVLAANLFSDEVRDAFDPRIVKAGGGGS